MSRETITVENKRYTMSATGDNSEKYGNCEVCDKYCSDVHSQFSEHHYHFEHDGEVFDGWSRHNEHSHMGHKDCLLSKRNFS